MDAERRSEASLRADPAAAAESAAADPALEAYRAQLAGPGNGWHVCDVAVAESGRLQVEKLVASCGLCGKGFGMATKKLHCAQCGVVSCKECSDEAPNTKKRVCVGCKASSAV
jgi:hypothetical protein